MMNHSTLKYAGLIVCCNLILQGCGDFLKPKSQSEFIPTTADQLNDLVISALPYPSRAMTFTCGLMDLCTDDVETGPYISTTTEPAYSNWYKQSYMSAIYAMYTWQPNSGDFMATNSTFPQYSDYNIYGSLYTKLVYANAPLDYIDKVVGTDSRKNYVKAQALALRAFYYLQLVNVYGEPYSAEKDGLGVPIRTTAAKENRKMVRNSVHEVYNLILTDLQQALELFNHTDVSFENEYFRPKPAMVLLLLARTYLYMGNWEQAEFYADKLIKDYPQYQIADLAAIVQNYSNLRTTDPSATAAAKCEQTFYPFMSYSNPDVIWLYNGAADMVTITGKEMRGDNTLANEKVSNNGRQASMMHASASLMACYDDSDLRLQTYFVRDLYSEPTYTDGGGEAPSVSRRLYRAYGKLTINEGSVLPADGTRMYGQALRITEAYLILAEAQAMQDKPQALETLRQIWSRRFANGTPPAAYTSGVDNITLVRRERRRELCFEALRWFDLRRWETPRLEHVWWDTERGTKKTFVLQAGDPSYTFALPKTIMDANADLVQVPLGADGKERNPE